MQQPVVRRAHRGRWGKLVFSAFGKREVDPRTGREPTVKRLGRQHPSLWWQQRAIRVGVEQPVAVERFLPIGRDGFGNRTQGDPERVGQIVEEGGGFVEKEWQIVFDPGGQQPLTDLFVQGHFAGIALEGFAKTAAEGRAPLVVGGKLACRQEFDRLHRVERALGVGVERFDGFDFVVEEFDPIGERCAHRVEVDDPTANREFSGAKHLGRGFVSGQGQLGFERRQIERFPFAGAKHSPGNERRRRKSR